MSPLPLPVINRNRNVVPIPHKIFQSLTYFIYLTTLQFLQFLQHLTTFYNTMQILQASRTNEPSSHWSRGCGVADTRRKQRELSAGLRIPGIDNSKQNKKRGSVISGTSLFITKYHTLRQVQQILHADTRRPCIVITSSVPTTHYLLCRYMISAP